MPLLDPEALICRFCSAWEERNLAAILAMLSPDIIYQNVPRPEHVGKAAVTRILEPTLRDSVQIEFKLLAIAVSRDGRSVLTERLDRIHFAHGTIDIPLMGIFEIGENGLIMAWRDYPDSQHIAHQLEQLKTTGAP